MNPSLSSRGAQRRGDPSRILRGLPQSASLLRNDKSVCSIAGARRRIIPSETRAGLLRSPRLSRNGSQFVLVFTLRRTQPDQTLRMRNRPMHCLLFTTLAPFPPAAPVSITWLRRPRRDSAPPRFFPGASPQCDPKHRALRAVRSTPRSRRPPAARDFA